MTPTLADLLQDPQRVAEVPSEVLPFLLGDLERLRAILWTRMMGKSNGQPDPSAEPRGLLDIQAAAKALHVSTDWLYRRAQKLPFTVRLGPRQLRFSSRGIDRYIRLRLGRG